MMDETIWHICIIVIIQTSFEPVDGNEEVGIGFHEFQTEPEDTEIPL